MRIVNLGVTAEDLENIRSLSTDVENLSNSVSSLSDTVGDLAADVSELNSGTVKKSNTSNTLYGKNDQGGEDNIYYSSDYQDKGWQVVIRDGNSDVLVPDTPTSDNGATSKKYTDKSILDKVSLLNNQSQISGGTYPRLLKYNENKLYLFLDNQYRVSNDGGKTWSEPIILFTASTEVQESGRAINDVGNAYAFLSPNNDGRIVVLYRSLNRDIPFFSICAKVSDANGENFGARQELFNSTSGYWEPFYYKGWVYYSSEHDGSGSDKAQSIYRRTIHVDLNGIVSVGSGTRFLDGRNKVDTDGNVNNKSRLGMISAAPIENGHIFVFESSVNINASTPRPLVVQYCYVKHPEDNPASPTSVVNLFLGSSGKKCGAPFVTTLDDGRIVISFQTNEKYTGYSRTDFRDSQFVAFVSKRKVTYNDSLTADDFVKLTTYEYGENECGILGSVSNIDGILYKAFTIGKNASFGYFNYGNLVQKCLLEYNIPYLTTSISSTTVGFIIDTLHNQNNKYLSNYNAVDITVSDYPGVQILYTGGEEVTGDICTQEQAGTYLKSMCGSDYVPTYNFDYPSYPILIDRNGQIYRPQWDSTNGLVLFKVTNPFLTQVAFADLQGVSWDSTTETLTLTI